jgi:hypothetical protein
VPLRCFSSRSLYNSAESGGRSGNWVDGTARRWIQLDLQDGNRHLAKVGVAGSNPVFRSKDAGHRQFSGAPPKWGSSDLSGDPSLSSGLFDRDPGVVNEESP